MSMLGGEEAKINQGNYKILIITGHEYNIYAVPVINTLVYVT